MSYTLHSSFYTFPRLVKFVGCYSPEFADRRPNGYDLTEDSCELLIISSREEQWIIGTEKDVNFSRS